MSGNQDANSHVATEQELVELWTDVLQPKRTIDTDDGFFDLGGDSLAAMLVIARVRTAYGVELLLEDFFMQDATIRQFAAMIDQMKQEETNQL